MLLQLGLNLLYFHIAIVILLAKLVQNIGRAIYLFLEIFFAKAVLEPVQTGVAEEEAQLVILLVRWHAVIAQRGDHIIVHIQNAVTVALDAVLVQVVLFVTLVAGVILDLFLLYDLAIFFILDVDFVKFLFALWACVPFLGPVEDAVKAVFVFAPVDIGKLFRSF